MRFKLKIISLLIVGVFFGFIICYFYNIPTNNKIVGDFDYKYVKTVFGGELPSNWNIALNTEPIFGGINSLQESGAYYHYVQFEDKLQSLILRADSRDFRPAGVSAYGASDGNSLLIYGVDGKDLERLMKERVNDQQVKENNIIERVTIDGKEGYSETEINNEKYGKVKTIYLWWTVLKDNDGNTGYYGSEENNTKENIGIIITIMPGYEEAITHFLQTVDLDKI